MIKIDTEDLVRQLEELEKTITRKLEASVRGLAEEVAFAAIENTPRGDLDTYRRLYESRMDWPKVPGLAQGNWQYTEGVVTFRLIAGESSGEAALDGVITNSQGYKLGQTFYIANNTPYIGLLEDGYSMQARDGIMSPASNMVFASYQVNLERYFNEQN